MRKQGKKLLAILLASTMAFSMPAICYGTNYVIAAQTEGVSKSEQKSINKLADVLIDAIGYELLYNVENDDSASFNFSKNAARKEIGQRVQYGEKVTAATTSKRVFGVNTKGMKIQQGDWGTAYPELSDVQFHAKKNGQVEVTATVNWNDSEISQVSKIGTVKLTVKETEGSYYGYVAKKLVINKAAKNDSKEETTKVTTADEALALLKQGNQNYLNPDTDASLREDLTTNGQHPYAVVITCSDSRVAPEILFDSKMGDIFVIRTAGNVVDAFERGSVEYGAEHLGSPLVVVLGHSNCGAVTAATETEVPGGDIKTIVDSIKPSVEEARKTTSDEVEVLNEAIKLNVKNSIAQLEKSAILEELQKEGKLKIVGAVYNITSGKVEFME